jgi:hypothetical protein
MTWAIVVGVLALILGGLFVATRLGAANERAEQAEGKVKTSKKMLEASVKAPKTKKGVTDRLRKGKF